MKKKAKIYKPTKSSMQSGLMKTKEWVLEYIVHNEQINPLMGWQSSSNTLSEVKMTFNSKEDAIDYAKKNKINYLTAIGKKTKSYKDINGQFCGLFKISPRGWMKIEKFIKEKKINIKKIDITSFLSKFLGFVVGSPPKSIMTSVRKLA